MKILTIRTDKEESELGLFEDTAQVHYEKWQAHRQLAETIHSKIKFLLTTQRMSWHDLGGIVVYEGPGSFTGLRIGISTANALSYGLSLPSVGSAGEDWISDGIRSLQNGQINTVVLPLYGSDANITIQRK